MAYDVQLADRIRTLVQRRRGWTGTAMFGGFVFLLGDHICVGVWNDSLIARVGPGAYPDALREPFVREFNVTGRSMTGWVLVENAGLEDDAELAGWIERCVRFVRSLPPKPC